MRILFVLENYLPHIGGVEVVFKTLAEALAKDHEVNIVTHRLRNTKKFEIINKVKVHRVDCLHSRYLFTFLAPFKVFQLAKKADLIHTTTFNGAPPAWLISKLLRKKCIITVHEIWINHWKEYTNFNLPKRILHDFLERLIYLLPFDKYVAVSKSTEKQLHNIGINPKKTKVIYNGVDYEHFKPRKHRRNKTFTCLIRGRAGPSKGIEYAVRAFKNINAKLILMLNNQYPKENNYLKSIATKNVIFREPVSWKELPEVINQADCVIVPSLAEGFGFNAAEACAMNIPVITTNTTSLPEVVSNKYILVPPKNSEAIAEAIIKRNYKISKLKRFETSKNINNYLNIYNKLLTLGA